MLLSAVAMEVRRQLRERCHHVVDAAAKDEEAVALPDEAPGA